VPLRAKQAINFHDAVFYYPADQTADDDDNRRGPAHVVSEGRVPAATATACCSSDDRLPVKEAVSMQPGVGDDMPLIACSAASRRRPSMLRKVKAFFGRSSSSATGDDVSRAGRQLSAADASMMTPAVWTELDEGSPVSAAVGAVGVEDPGAARPARSYTSPPTHFFDGGEWKAERHTVKTGPAVGTETVGEAAAGEQPWDVKNNDEELMCNQPSSYTKP